MFKVSLFILLSGIFSFTHSLPIQAKEVQLQLKGSMVPLLGDPERLTGVYLNGSKIDVSSFQSQRIDLPENISLNGYCLAPIAALEEEKCSMIEPMNTQLAGETTSLVIDFTFSIFQLSSLRIIQKDLQEKIIKKDEKKFPTYLVGGR